MPETIDAIDSNIIQLLKKDGRMPNTEIAKKLKISETTVRKRVKKLIKNEFIQVVAVVNHYKVGKIIVGNIKINVDTTKTDHVTAELNKLDGLWFIAHLTGAVDFDVEFGVKTHDELRRLLDAINKIDGVLHTATSFRLKLIKNQYEWETPRAPVTSK